MSAYFKQRIKVFTATWDCPLLPRESKIWPTVSRINSAYGDRNLVYSGMPVDSYEPEELQVSVGDLN